MATSLTVPCTASEPMSPPGKNSGETTKQSVDITMRPAATSKAAWSSPRASIGLSKAGRKISSMSCCMARPPAPCVRSTRPGRKIEPARAQARCTGGDVHCAALPHPAVIVVGGAGALRGHHAGAERRFRRAGAAEQPAVGRLLGAAQDRRAVAGLVALGRDIGFVEAALGIERREFILEAERRIGDVAEAAPFEVAPQLEDARHRLLGAQIAVAGDRADILVLDLGAALVELAHQHQDRLQDIDRLEAGDRDRLAVLLGEELVGLAADDDRDMRRPEEAVDLDGAELAHRRRLEDRGDRRRGEHVIAEHRESSSRPFLAAASIASAVGGVVVSKPMAKKITSRSGLACASFTASSVE